MPGAAGNERTVVVFGAGIDRHPEGFADWIPRAAPARFAPTPPLI